MQHFDLLSSSVQIWRLGITRLFTEESDFILLQSRVTRVLSEVNMTVFNSFVIDENNL